MRSGNPWGIAEGIFKGVTDERPLTPDESKALLELVTSHYQAEPYTRGYSYETGRAYAWVWLAMGNPEASYNEMLAWIGSQFEQHKQRGHETPMHFYYHLYETLNMREWDAKERGLVAVYFKHLLGAQPLSRMNISLIARDKVSEIDNYGDIRAALEFRTTQRARSREIITLTHQERLALLQLSIDQPLPIEGVMLDLLLPVSDAAVPDSEQYAGIPEDDYRIRQIEDDYPQGFAAKMRSLLAPIGLTVLISTEEDGTTRYRLARKRSSQVDK